MKETRTLVINSQNTTNRSGSNTRAYQYYINWSAVLPNPENINQQYQARFAFSTPTQGSFGEVFTLSIDFGGSNMYDQTNNKSTYLGCVYPVANHGAALSGTDTVFFIQEQQ